MGAFDLVAWERERMERIAASRAAGRVHLSDVPQFVETMRGRRFSCVHDAKERGTVRTVATSGEVVVHWDDEYSAGKNMAGRAVDGRRSVWQSWLMPSDLKDYVFDPNS